MIYAIDIQGTITRYNQLPKGWGEAPNYNSTPGYRASATPERIYTDGFRELKIPALTVYQRLGDILYIPIVYDIDLVTILEIDYYIYDIIDFTQQEIDDYDENITNTQFNNIIYTNESGCIQLFHSIKVLIRRARDLGDITPAQAKGFRTNLAPIIRPLREGDADLAKENLDAMDIPGDPDVVTVLNEIKTLVNDYITNIYIP